MRRILLLMAVAAAMAVTMVASAMPAFADGLGPSQCKEDILGEDFSDQARSEGEGFSGTSNPGTAQSQHPPFVPFGLSCNPTAVVAEP